MDKINDWFNCTKYGPSPQQVVDEMVYYFCSDVKELKLGMCVSKQHFYSILCEGMCVLYDQNLKNEYGHLKISNTSYFEQPPGWNQEVESIWIDYLNSRIFDADYWDCFWDYFGTYEWESEVFNWRAEFQTLMPYYVSRSMYMLLSESIVEAHDEETGSTSSVGDSDCDDHNK